MYYFRVSEIKQARGPLSIREAAQIAGVNKTTIVEWEKGNGKRRASRKKQQAYKQALSEHFIALGENIAGALIVDEEQEESK